MLTEMTLDEKVLGKYIKDMINKRVAEEDRRAFVQSLIARIDGQVFLSDIDIEKQYGDVLYTILHDIDYADSRHGVNINQVKLDLGNEYDPL